MAETVAFWRGVLPHWEVVDGRYFVTLRLANSLPVTLKKRLRDELSGATRSDYLVHSRRYFKSMEAWLDHNVGNQLLGNSAVAAYVADTVRKYEELGYWHVSSWAILPNHIHLFLRCGALRLADVMRRFKKSTAREGNRILDRKGRPFWQREWFDHWSRSPGEDDRIVSYIRNNPVRAGLGPDWPWVK